MHDAWAAKLVPALLRICAFTHHWALAPRRGPSSSLWGVLCTHAALHSQLETSITFTFMLLRQQVFHSSEQASRAVPVHAVPKANSCCSHPHLTRSKSCCSHLPCATCPALVRLEVRCVAILKQSFSINSQQFFIICSWRGSGAGGCTHPGKPAHRRSITPPSCCQRCLKMRLLLLG